jgi:hypothetical protein
VNKRDKRDKKDKRKIIEVIKSANRMKKEIFENMIFTKI